MELSEAIEIMLTANGSMPYSRYDSVTVTDFVKASEVVLNAMRDEITTSEVMKWCIAHRPIDNNGTYQKIGV